MANTLSARIDSTEKDFVSHLKKVEDRLDILVDLTKTVAVMNTQMTQYVDQLHEVRMQARENFTKIDGHITTMTQKSDASIARLHTRIDELSNSIRERIELSHKDIELGMKAMDSDHDALRQKVDGWINWGKGAYAVGGLLMAFLTWTGGRWLDDLEKRMQLLSTLKTDMITIDSRVIEMNHKLEAMKK